MAAALAIEMRAMGKRDKRRVRASPVGGAVQRKAALGGGAAEGCSWKAADANKRVTNAGLVAESATLLNLQPCLATASFLRENPPQPEMGIPNT